MIVVITPFFKGGTAETHLIHVDVVNKNVLSGIVRDVSRIYDSGVNMISMEIGQNYFSWQPDNMNSTLDEIARIFDVEYDPLSPVSEK